MNNEKRTTEATLTLASNGYILDMQDAAALLLVYEGQKLPDDIGRELLSDLDALIDQGEYGAFHIRVEVTPIPDVPFEKKQL